MNDTIRRRYRIWDGRNTEYFEWLTEAEVIELRRQGYYVNLI